MLYFPRLGRLLAFFGHVLSLKPLARRIGYRFHYSAFPAAWIPGVVSLDMTRSWHKHGIKAIGLNYWTIGALRDGVSTRYVPDAKQYQSWLGAYLVRFLEDREFTLQDHFNLAVADQKNWLEDLGDTEPFITMDAIHAQEREDIFLWEYKVKMYETVMNPSHSDVGPRSHRVFARWLLSIGAGMFAELSGADVMPQACLPRPQDANLNYEMVNLKGYIGVVFLEKNVYLVLYGNAAERTLPDGTKQDFYPLLKQDILDAFASGVIEKIA